jgi:chemotaxis protein methyltransferase WspC
LVYATIAALLKEKMGLDAESIGVASVERAVRQRLAARGLTDVQVYWTQLSASEHELQELIEAIVIPETWFFRDPQAFTALLQVVREEWLAKHAEGTLRILSLPCSTGEEPFSTAMALLDGGLPPSRFHIDAIDISTRAIAWAERGVYGKNSFRGKDLGFRDRYFEPVEHGYRVADGVRRQVHFRHGNLLSAGWLHGAHGYDVIFCRNVLIYFDLVTQRRAIDVLGRLLTASGLLFVGPSETALLLDHGFVSAGIPLAFAFRQAGSSAPQLRSRQRMAPAALSATPVLAKPVVAQAVLANPVVARAVLARPSQFAATKPPLKSTSAEKTFAASEHWIEQARSLANQGKLVEALECCEHNMRSQPASAETFHLIGLLHDAAGRVREAAEHYRKALYLDPQHPEALVHLAVALQKDGDARGAQRLFERANRRLGPGENKGGSQ